MNLAVYPVKGYSVTMPVLDPAKTPAVRLTGDEYKLVMSRLDDRMRIAGTAELNGYDTALNPTRCRAILTRFEACFPGACDASRAQFWTGLRPATPGNVPLADIVSGRKPRGRFPIYGFLESKSY